MTRITVSQAIIRLTGSHRNQLYLRVRVNGVRGYQRRIHLMILVVRGPKKVRINTYSYHRRDLGESSETIRTRVEAARQRQRERFAVMDIACNADMRSAEVRKFCALDDICRSLMKSAMCQLQLSARTYHRVLKPARTIAGLAGIEAIAPTHLAEAIQYRPRKIGG